MRLSELLVQENNIMHSMIRKGLLGTLFAGGLIALGATAANAADTTTSALGNAQAPKSLHRCPFR